MFNASIAIIYYICEGVMNYNDVERHKLLINEQTVAKIAESIICFRIIQLKQNRYGINFNYQ